MRNIKALTATVLAAGAVMLAASHTNHASADPAHGYTAGQGATVTGAHRIVVGLTVPKREMSSVLIAASELRSFGASVSVQRGNNPVMGNGVIYIRRVPLANCHSNAWADTHRWAYNATVNNWRTTVNAYDIIDVCPRLVVVRSAIVSRASMEHEIGHAFGLEHFNNSYGGQLQVMNSNIDGTYAGYRSGDRNGIIALLHNARLARI